MTYVAVVMADRNIADPLASGLKNHLERHAANTPSSYVTFLTTILLYTTADIDRKAQAHVLAVTGFRLRLLYQLLQCLSGSAASPPPKPTSA